MGWWRRIGLTFSLTAAMTGSAVWLLIVASGLWESTPYSWRGDDDWLWLMLPLGAAIGLVLWLRYWRRPWIHYCGVLMILSLVVSIGRILLLETQQGMAGLGIGIGKAIAAATAYAAAVTGLISLAIALVVIVALTWRKSQTNV